MLKQALILADRPSGAFAQVTDGTLPALLPIAGKPVLQHCIEDAWEAGVREMTIVTPVGDRSIRSALGEGERFGAAIRYVEVTGGERLQALLGRLFTDDGSRVLLARGDVLRGRVVRALNDQPTSGDDRVVHGIAAGHHCGVVITSRPAHAVAQLEWETMRGALLQAEASAQDVGSAGFSPLECLRDLYDASLGALDGGFAGLIADGRRAAGSALRIAPRATIAPSTHVDGCVRVGRGAEVHRGVELGGRTEIGDGCVIDVDAHLVDAVVLPGTYVGRGVRLQDAIASGPWLYRADLGLCQRVDDPLLLAGLARRAAA